MQAAVELVLGFEKSWVTKENLATNQARFLAWTDAFTHAPLDLPGFSKFLVFLFFASAYILLACLCYHPFTVLTT